MTGERKILEIRHRLVARGSGFEVIENFADMPEQRCPVASREVGEALIKHRRTFLLQMVADISPTARQAVADARYVDNLKAGHA